MGSFEALQHPERREGPWEVTDMNEDLGDNVPGEPCGHRDHGRKQCPALSARHSVLSPRPSTWQRVLLWGAGDSKSPALKTKPSKGQAAFKNSTPDTLLVTNVTGTETAKPS